jgi:hypothetical protein
MPLLPVLLVDLGLALTGVALLSLLRPLRFLGIASRRRALAVGLCGLLAALLGLFLPAPTVRAQPPVTRLDAAVPEWQFAEFHQTRVRASPARVEAAIREVTAREIRGFGLLTWIRHPRLPESGEEPHILAAPADRPILDVALGSGFVELARAPCERVIGTLVIVPTGTGSISPAREGASATAEDFAALVEPGFAKAAMNFQWSDDGGGWTRLSTTTRIAATSPGARRRFAAYWRVIYPGSAFLRRSWLEAIRRRAEADPPADT